MGAVEHAQVEERTRGRAGRGWLLPAVLVVVAVVAGLVGAAVGRATAPEPAPAAAPTIEGLAEPQVAALLAERMRALNAGDVAAMERIYAEDAVLWEGDQNPPVVTRGSKAIAAHLAEYAGLGFRLEPASVALQGWGVATELSQWSGGGGVLVYRFDGDGRIAYQWVIS